MIDTDKYEGHTPAPWKALLNHPQVEGSCVVSDEDEVNFGYTKWDGTNHFGHGDGPLWLGELTDDMPDAKLIADAPLLLAEVMRLRGVIAQVWDLMQNSNHQDREAYFWGFDGKNTGWMKVHEELAMRELNWGEEE